MSRLGVAAFYDFEMMESTQIASSNLGKYDTRRNSPPTTSNPNPTKTRVILYYSRSLSSLIALNSSTIRIEIGSVSHSALPQESIKHRETCMSRSTVYSLVALIPTAHDIDRVQQRPLWYVVQLHCQYSLHFLTSFCSICFAVVFWEVAQQYLQSFL